MSKAIKLTIEARGQGRSAILLAGALLTVGGGAIVCGAARKLIERGHDPDERIEAWRGSTLCLAGRLGVFARLTVDDHPDGIPRFRQNRPPGSEGRSPKRLIEAEAAE